MPQCPTTVATEFPATPAFSQSICSNPAAPCVAHIDALRDAVRTVRARRPCAIDAWVVLPDHMHAVWTPPADDADFSSRWRAIKIAFAKGLPDTERLSPVRAAKGERGIWQRRFCEHAIRDQPDYAAHVNYVHVNPVKHGLVACVRDWPYSSFHRYVAKGEYIPDWAGEGDDDPILST